MAHTEIVEKAKDSGSLTYESLQVRERKFFRFSQLDPIIFKSFLMSHVKFLIMVGVSCALVLLFQQLNPDSMTSSSDGSSESTVHPGVWAFVGAATVFHFWICLHLLMRLSNVLESFKRAFNSLAHGDTPKFFKIRAEDPFQSAADMLDTALKEIRRRDRLIEGLEKKIEEAGLEAVTVPDDSCIVSPDDAAVLPD